MSTWPADPQGDMVPILEASVEAAKKRHPSGAPSAPVPPVLTAADRCDEACPAAAVYRVAKPVAPGYYSLILEFCGHHWRKRFPAMTEEGWVVVGANPDLVGKEDRLKGSDH